MFSKLFDQDIRVCHKAGDEWAQCRGQGKTSVQKS